MSTAKIKPAATITIEIDVLAPVGKSVVSGTLVCQPGGRPMYSFSGGFTDAEIATLLPEWMAELRAEAALGRFETLAEQKARLAGQASSGECSTDTTSLNSTCTSLSPDGSGPRSLVR